MRTHINKTSATVKKAIAAAIVGHFFWGLSFMASRMAPDTAPVILLLSYQLPAFVFFDLRETDSLPDRRIFNLALGESRCREQRQAQYQTEYQRKEPFCHDNARLMN
jgi:hypothetical protein